VNVCDVWETPLFNENKLLYECKILQNKIVKGIEILILNFFCIVYKFVKSMVGDWCDIIIIHKKI